MDRFIARMKKASGRRGGDKTKPLRKLERIGPLRNVNYDAASSSSSSADDLSVSTSSLLTRSLEVDRTDFRIFGRGDGEIDRICKSIGVSGPDDFAISFDAWEASKMRSSSEVINRFNSLDHDLSEIGPSADANSVSSEIESLADKVVVDGGGIKENKRSLQRVMSKGYLVRDVVPAVVVVVGGGIKGVRPPVLKPPPARQPTMDHQGSSWDFLTHFAPEDDIVRRRPSSSSSSSSDKVEEEVEMQARVLESDESCSFSTNGGGDSSSTVSPVYSSGSVITSWLKGELLGRGSFGSVYEGISCDGYFFAVKEVSLVEQGSQAQESIQQLEREIALLSQLQHQNIVRYRGTAKDGSNLYIFLELVSQGSLLKLYQKYQLPDSVVSTYTRQILDGLKYLHGEGFIHRDIKCANILVDASGAVKLADFGLAKVSKLNDIKSCRGTPFWMAPEVIDLKRTDGYGSSADIWSLGCTVLEMLTQKIPYSDLEPGLVKAVHNLLPEAEHRQCCRHIYENWRKGGKDLRLQRFFWCIARSYTPGMFKYNMDELKSYDPLAHASLIKTKPETWSRAYFKIGSHCNDNLNNLCESFNKTIREARKKPLLDLLEEIRRQCMTRNFTRSKMAADRKTRFTMKTHKELDRVEKKCHECILRWAIGPETEVEYQDQCYVVSLEKETCACRGWQMNGIPCIHAAKVILGAKRKLSEFVAECYTTSKWRETYNYGITPVNGMIEWPQTNRLGVIPPPNRTGNPGRPKNHDRKKGANETKSTTKMSRANRVMTCSNCKEEGHYKNKCNKGSVPSPPKKPRGRPRKYQFQALYKIGKGELPDIPDTLSLDARDFIIRCLRVNPEERPTAAELLNHPFVKRPLSSSGSGIKNFASP